MDIREIITDIIVDKLGVDETEVTDYARLADDLGADSLDSVELTMCIEKAFDIEIPDIEVESIVTVRDLVNLVNAHLTHTSYIRDNDDICQPDVENDDIAQ